MTWIHPAENAIVLQLRVIPRASKDAVGEIMDNALKIRLQAPPVEGKANKALAAFLAKTLGIPKRQVEILSGEKGRNKRVGIEGITVSQARKRLEH